jgi:hypothetical protein
MLNRHLFVLTLLIVASARAAQDLPPAATPSEAVARHMEALATGDEDEYRRVVVFREPSEAAQAYVRQLLAAVRLHRAVREHAVIAERTPGTPMPRNERLMVIDPVPPETLAQVRPMADKIQWTIDGNVATSQTTRVERIDGGWFLVLTDANSTETPQRLREMVENSKARIATFEAAIEQVKAGKLRTVREVNDFVSPRHAASRPATSP